MISDAGVFNVQAISRMSALGADLKLQSASHSLVGLTTTSLSDSFYRRVDPRLAHARGEVDLNCCMKL